MYYGYGMDPTYILVLIGVVLSLIASNKLKATYSRYARIPAASGLTGAQVAQKILHANGIYDVSVGHVAGELTDHYDPSSKTVNLSDVIYAGTSVAALGVAAHECGHAIQDNTGYAPLRFRTVFVPIANFGSRISWILIIAGMLFGGAGYAGGGIGDMLIEIGIFAFMLAVLFQIVTLPVEYNASRRALAQLKETGIMGYEEESGARNVLSAAALTYVAAAASAVLQLLRLLLIFGGNRNRRS